MPLRRVSLTTGRCEVHAARQRPGRPLELGATDAVLAVLAVLAVELEQEQEQLNNIGPAATAAALRHHHCDTITATLRHCDTATLRHRHCICVSASLGASQHGVPKAGGRVPPCRRGGRQLAPSRPPRHRSLRTEVRGTPYEIRSPRRPSCAWLWRPRDIYAARGTAAPYRHGRWLAGGAGRPGHAPWRCPTRSLRGVTPCKSNGARPVRKRLRPYHATSETPPVRRTATAEDSPGDVVGLPLVVRLPPMHRKGWAKDQSARSENNLPSTRRRSLRTTVTYGRNALHELQRRAPRCLWKTAIYL